MSALILFFYFIFGNPEAIPLEFRFGERLVFGEITGLLESGLLISSDELTNSNYRPNKAIWVGVTPSVVVIQNTGDHYSLRPIPKSFAIDYNSSAEFVFDLSP